jgi:hypothetical protein
MMSVEPVVNTRAYHSYVNRTTGHVILALELTEELITLMRHTPGLKEQAGRAQPGDFTIGMEAQIMPAEQFHDEYMSVGQQADS